MRVSKAGFTLFQRGELCLLCWNKGWNAYSMIGGHVESGESFFDAAVREATEELQLPGSAFAIGEIPIASLTFDDYSQAAECETAYKWKLFQADFTCTEHPILPGDCIWASREAIRLGATESGKAIAEQVRRLITAISHPGNEISGASVEKKVEPVQYSGRVREELTDSIRRCVSDDLVRVFDEVDLTRDSAIIVPRLFSGYDPAHDKKVVMAVEINKPDGYERHIVKLGNRDDVEVDFRGWQECTGGRMVASRIFSPVRMVDLGDDRVAVIYRDAYSLFGPEDEQSEESSPKLLEDALKWTVVNEEPDPLSAQRAISHVYTDLGMWFYRGAREDAAAAHRFYSKRLRVGDEEDAILPLWQKSELRGTLRRHAVWVLCGADKPDADPSLKPARYLDPVDFVDWATRNGDGSRLPGTLVGRAHGDLHARNILVGVRRGEVQYPAVFDYGEMGVSNVLAWDFAKLETELKVRLLNVIIRDPQVFSWLGAKSGLRGAATEAPTAGLESTNSRRADRMAAFLAFEELIDDATNRIEDEHDVDRVCLLSPPPTGIKMLDRLVGIVLRVRQEAAYWLGYKHAKRQASWKDELYFALGVYGLLNVRWDYSDTAKEAALISSGVALARMPSMSQMLRDATDLGFQQDGSYPSYRVPLALSFREWQAKRIEQGCKLVESKVIELVKNTQGSLTKLLVRPQSQHAIPLIGQALLLELEAGNLHVVEPVLEQMREEARTFRDFETLARVGRVYKDVADRKWEVDVQIPGEGNLAPQTRAPWLQMYDKSFDVYSEAYELTKDWYVGINAATLALLTGRNEQAVNYAREVAVKCADMLDHNKKDRYWLFATEGEAAIILNESAYSFYESALNELSASQSGMADSSYRQAIRLWKFFGDDGERRVGPVLTLFEQSEYAPYLARNFLGRNTLGSNE